MEDRKQYYRVIDINGNIVAENMTSAAVSVAYDIGLAAVSNYAIHCRLVKGKYYIEKQNELPEKLQKQTEFHSIFWEQWRNVTESIKNKVIWCDRPDAGVRKLYIRNKTKKGDQNVNKE